MPGHFYVPPPVNLGGRQPYAPRPGLPQSAPAADSPPGRLWAIQRAIINTHAPTLYAIPRSPNIAAFLTGQTSDPPPPLNRSGWGIIQTHWNVDKLTVIQLCSVAPFLATPAAADNPPIRSYANFNTILRNWQPPFIAQPKRALTAPLVPDAVTPDNPPTISYTLRGIILDQWRAPYIPLPTLRISTVASVGSPDTVPDAYAFLDQDGVALSTVITSNTVTIQGLNAGAVITVTGGTYSINGGGFTSSSGSVNNGDTIQARHTSSGSYNTATNTTVTIGGVSDTFTSTTRAEPAAGGSGTHRARIGGMMVFH